MTPQKVADISEPIEQLYSDLTDELLINIARHLSKSTATWSALHEIETLEEMGQLTQENIEIINTYVTKMPEEIKKAMNESRLEALGEIENKLQQAADNGYLTKPVTDSTVDVVQALSNQAAEQLNLVNQTMLNTSLQQYQNGIYEFRQEMQNAAPRTIESVEDLQIAQNEINIAAGKTVTGTETRYNAMRKAISNLNKAGIVGYYDRANRAWTAEAYVNMDIRTTVHNTYIQSVQTRQQDYGSDVFQVSAHAGARPLCYPYQGKLYSWGASGGTIRLGDGKTYKYEPIGETSYGEPAGLFGINCGHVPYPMIAGVSEPVKEDIQSKEENDKQYQDSQKQRALERQIRYAKRNVEMLGDLATDADRDKIKQAQAQMRAFIQSTGRTRRYDREQIVTQRGATGIKPTIKTPVTPNNTVITTQISDRYTGTDQKTLDFIDLCDKRGIVYNRVTDRTEKLSEEQIINLLGGGDKTSGSCASVGLAYIGQKNGWNVLDFRGGESQDVFSDYATIHYVIPELPNLKVIKETARAQATAGNKLLKQVEKNKEYYFACGQHAAIVRKTANDKLQYLELQADGKWIKNGWTDFNGNPRYTLANRFDATKSGNDYEAVMIEVSSCKGSEELREILGYINTAENEQKKGNGGGIR